jgi:hypothetical protein
VAVEINAGVGLRTKKVDHERDTKKGRDFQERFVEDEVIARNVDLPPGSLLHASRMPLTRSSACDAAVACASFVRIATLHCCLCPPFQLRRWQFVEQ